MADATVPEHKIFIWGVNTASSSTAELEDSVITSISIVEYESSTIYGPSTLNILVISQVERNTKTTQGSEHVASTFAEAWPIVCVFVNQRTPPSVTPLMVTSREAGHHVDILRTELRRTSLPSPQWGFVCVLDVYDVIPGSLPLTRSARTRRLGLATNGDEKSKIEARCLAKALHILAPRVEAATKRSLVSILADSPCYLNIPSVSNLLFEDEIKVYRSVEDGREDFLKRQLENAACFTTRTGTRYHLDASCGGLRNAVEKISIRNPELSGLLPCKRCVLGDKPKMESGENSENIVEKKENSHYSGNVVVANPGNIAHADMDCPNLHSAKSWGLIRTPSSSLTWCILCAPTALSSIKKEAHTETNEHKPVNDETDEYKKRIKQKGNRQKRTQKHKCYDQDEGERKQEIDELEKSDKLEKIDVKVENNSQSDKSPEEQEIGETTPQKAFIQSKGHVNHTGKTCRSLTLTSNLVQMSGTDDVLSGCRQYTQSSEDDNSRHPERNRTETSSKASVKQRAEVSEKDSTDAETKDVQTITTPTGKLYHSSETCTLLHFARSTIPTNSPPTHLKACPQCYPSRNDSAKT